MRSISYVALVLCALMVAASLDTVPDPPAVRYFSGLDAKALDFSSAVGGYQRQCVNSEFPIFFPQGAVRWVAVRHVDDTSRSDYGRLLTRYAADTSPPTLVV